MRMDGKAIHIPTGSFSATLQLDFRKYATPNFSLCSPRRWIQVPRLAVADDESRFLLNAQFPSPSCGRSCTPRTALFLGSFAPGLEIFPQKNNLHRRSLWHLKAGRVCPDLAGHGGALVAIASSRRVPEALIRGNTLSN